MIMKIITTMLIMIEIVNDNDDDDDNIDSNNSSNSDDNGDNDNNYANNTYITNKNRIFATWSLSQIREVTKHSKWRSFDYQIHFAYLILFGFFFTLPSRCPVLEEKNGKA